MPRGMFTPTLVFTLFDRELGARMGQTDRRMDRQTDGRPRQYRGLLGRPHNNFARLIAWQHIS